VHESWCDNKLRLSILVGNENWLLWSSADNVILVVYLIKFVFTCLFYSGWSVRVQIGSGLIRFGSFRVRVNKSSGQLGFDSGHVGFRINSDHYSFGSVRFWIGSISDFGLKSVQLFLISVQVWFRVVRFGSLLPGLVTRHMSPELKCLMMRSIGKNEGQPSPKRMRIEVKDHQPIWMGGGVYIACTQFPNLICFILNFNFVCRNGLYSLSWQ